MWRKCFGWLIGRYKLYDKVPIGAKAVLEAIHEPPQEAKLDGLLLGLPWTDKHRNQCPSWGMSLLCPLTYAFNFVFNISIVMPWF